MGVELGKDGPFDELADEDDDDDADEDENDDGDGWASSFLLLLKEFDINELDEPVKYELNDSSNNSRLDEFSLNASKLSKSWISLPTRSELESDPLPSVCLNRCFVFSRRSSTFKFLFG